MRKYFFSAMFLTLLISCNSSDKNEDITLKQAFKDIFYIGTALSEEQILGEDEAAIEVVKSNFNSITAENIMKSEVMQPIEGEFDFTLSDKFVEFGEQNDMQIIGHTLIWHSQAPDWFFVDENGDDVSPEVLTQRMRSHILTIAGRYKGRIHGWDVVNEAIEDDGSWRKSKFYEILGEDFIRIAFELAHEADPDAELYYNDYSMANEGRRNRVVSMVKTLQEQGVKIDGIGMQGHLNLNSPSIEDYEKSIQEFADLGVKIMITELDLSVLPSVRSNDGANVKSTFEYNEKINPYKDGLSKEVEEKQYQRYTDFFKLFVKYQDNIDRVTLWGVNDAQSWKNDWPVEGRTDYTLLFDRNNKPKEVVKDIINIVSNNN